MQVFLRPSCVTMNVPFAVFCVANKTGFLVWGCDQAQFEPYTFLSFDDTDEPVQLGDFVATLKISLECPTDENPIAANMTSSLSATATPSMEGMIFTCIDDGEESDTMTLNIQSKFR